MVFFSFYNQGGFNFYSIDTNIRGETIKTKLLLVNITSRGGVGVENHMSLFYNPMIVLAGVNGFTNMLQSRTLSLLNLFSLSVSGARSLG